MSHKCLIEGDLKMSYQKMSYRCLIGGDFKMSCQKMSFRCLVRDVLKIFYIIYQYFIQSLYLSVNNFT